MKTFNVVLAVCIMAVASGCKKKPEKDPVNNSDPAFHPEKVAFYKDKGFKYLFTVDKSQSDSVRPIFFGKSSKGQVKYILREYKAAAATNSARVFNGDVDAWNLPGFDVSRATWSDYYSLDENDFLEYESRYRSSPLLFYKEKNASIHIPGVSGIGDTVMINYAPYPYNYNFKEVSHLNYRHGSFSIKESFIYTGGLFGYRDKSYLVYYKPRVLDSQSTYADLNMMIRDKNGLLFKRDIFTNLVASYVNQGETVIEGNYPRLIETGTDEPVFMFWPNWESGSKSVSFISSVKTGDVFSVDFPFFAMYMKFFSYKGQLYGNNYGGELFMVGNAKPVAIDVPLNLERIKGVFGNSRAILVVVENDQKGLDIVELP